MHTCTQTTHEHSNTNEHTQKHIPPRQKPDKESDKNLPRPMSLRLGHANFLPAHRCSIH